MSVRRIWSSRYAEFSESGCAGIFWSSKFVDFEGSQGGPLRVECFGHNLFTKNSSSLNRVQYVSISMNRLQYISGSMNRAH
jgi:hypothetical protein